MASKTKNRLMNLIVSIFVCVFLAFVMLVAVSCQSYAKEDGTTGWKVGVSESTHETIANAGDTATDILGALSMIFPALGVAATAAGTGTLVWRRMKKDVTKYRDPIEMYVKVLEHIKVTDQETWEKVKASIKLQYPTIDIEATVREIKFELSRLKLLPSSSELNTAVVVTNNSISETDSVS